MIALETLILLHRSLHTKLCFYTGLQGQNNSGGKGPLGIVLSNPRSKDSQLQR